MEKKLQHFLNSDLLNKYLVGDISLEESKEVEHFISKYPEAAQAYEKLQDNLEIIAKAGAVDVPKNSLEDILDALEETNDTKVIQLVQDRKTPWYSIAASAAAILFAATSFMLYQKNIELNKRKGTFIHAGPGFSMIKPLGNYTQNKTSYLKSDSAITKQRIPDWIF